MLAGIVLTLVSLWYGHNHHLLPAEASVEAPLVDGLFDTMMTISTGLFLLVVGVLIISIFRFRQRPGDNTDAPPVHGNIPLEILWTSIPAVIVLGLSIYSFEVYNQMGGLDPMSHSGHSVAQGHSTHQMAMPGAAIAATLDESPDGKNVQPQDPATQAVRDDVPQRNDSPAIVSPQIGPRPDTAGQPPQLVVNATGLQYAWIFTYPDTGITSAELHLPVGREVLLNISANDVLHAFWVPEYRLKQDAIPGRQTELRFTPSKVGEYPVICAELCGAYHGAMRTKVIAESPEAYDAWIQEQQASAGSYDGAIAVADPATQTPDQFLAPYTREMGIDSTLLHQIQPHSDHAQAEQ